MNRSVKHQNMDFVDAKPSNGTIHCERGSELKDAAGFTDDQPIPRRRGSSFIRTPTSPSSKYYPMNNERRGKVLIFNHVTFDDVGKYPERKGSENDVKRLYHNTLLQLGFRKEDIQVFDDYCYSKINRTASDLKLDKSLEGSDCLMVIILTHGEKDDMLLARDGSYHLYEFMKNFTPHALPSMAGKPKLFVVQACRGNELDRGVLLKTDCIRGDYVDSLSDTFTYPEFADFLIVMSSHHGHASFRNEHGSWLIQELCSVIESCDLETSSIIDILIDTNDAVAKRTSRSEDSEKDNKKQIPSFYSTMTKRLYFRKPPTTSMFPAFQTITSTSNDE